MTLTSLRVCVAVAGLLGLSVVADADPAGVDLNEEPVRKVEPHYLANFDDESLSLFKQSKAAEAKGDYAAALRLMQRAADRQLSLKGFELWDNLASLYCKRAKTLNEPRAANVSRAAGRAMLNEFKCAADVWAGKRQCWIAGLESADDASADYRAGLVPNPAVSPLCFKTLCGAGFGARLAEKEDDHWGTLMESEPPEGYTSWPIEDSKDLGKIEKTCSGR